MPCNECRRHFVAGVIVEGSSLSRPTIFCLTAMFSSRLPTTSQADIHPRLEMLLRRHRATPWQAPLRQFSLSAFKRAETFIGNHPHLVLDSGCGTGHSTAWLANALPHALVIGIDQSADRLSRAPALPDNALLIRAELADFWRLAREAQWPVERHYLLYPNPWPKPAHVQRRWHGHPVFPMLLDLGGRLELRTNFLLYAEEFVWALTASGHADAQVLRLPTGEPVSAFERKYQNSGHPLYQVVVNLSDGVKT